MIGAMLCEVEGVLANTDPMRRAALLRALAEEGIESASLDDALPGRHRDDAREMVRIALRDHVLARDETALTLIAHRADRHFASLVRTGLSLAPGVHAMLAAAASRCRLAIVTGLDRATVDALLTLADLDGAFEVIVAAEDVAMAKPAPDGYRKALDRMRRRRTFDAHAAIAIEPGDIGARAAHAAGLRCVVISPDSGADAPHADVVLASLAGETPASLDALLSMQAAG
jgi:beta-phosphoglucomutase-like phosphatase (HAD superfamily)